MASFSNYIVSLKNIRHNLSQFKKYNKGVKICAVVKADAYGQGAVDIARGVNDLVDCFAVACVCEAKKLRSVTEKEILILNFIDKQDILECWKNNITITIYNISHIKQIEKLGCKINVHIAINTGMNRIGVTSLNELKLILKRIKRNPNIKLTGIFTHIYNHSSKYDTQKQFCIFNHFLKAINSEFNLKDLCIHTSASNASLKYVYQYNMVRLGILIYGYLDFKSSLKLKPALSITSKIIAINKIKKGDKVGYSRGFIATKSMTVATIPLGYADGIFRSYAKKGNVLIKGKTCKIIGNICMDMFMCDITNLKCKVGDKVTILGENKKLKVTAEDIANATNTISYEVLTNIRPNRMNFIVID